MENKKRVENRLCLLLFLISFVFLFMLPTAYAQVVIAFCNSCSDCNSKLTGANQHVTLTKDIVNQFGNCIEVKKNSIIFDCAGHKIDGDDSGELDIGIVVGNKRYVTIRNCKVSDFTT